MRWWYHRDKGRGAQDDSLLEIPKIMITEPLSHGRAQGERELRGEGRLLSNSDTIWEKEKCSWKKKKTYHLLVNKCQSQLSAKFHF